MVSMLLWFDSYSMSFADIEDYKQLFIDFAMSAHMDTTVKRPEAGVAAAEPHPETCCFLNKMTGMAFEDNFSCIIIIMIF